MKKIYVIGTLLMVFVILAAIYSAGLSGLKYFTINESEKTEIFAVLETETGDYEIQYYPEDAELPALLELSGDEVEVRDTENSDDEWYYVKEKKEYSSKATTIASILFFKMFDYSEAKDTYVIYMN